MIKDLFSNPFKGEEASQFGSSLMSATGQIGGPLIGGGYESGAGNMLQGLGGIASAIPGPWGAAASAALGIAGGITNRFFGSKLNTENIAKVESNIDKLNTFQSNASTFDDLSQNWANAATGMTFSNKFIGSDGIFSNKASNKARNLRNKISLGEARVNSTLTNNAVNIGNNQMQNLMANYKAYGGRLYDSGGGIASRHQGSEYTLDTFRNSYLGKLLFGNPNKPVKWAFGGAIDYELANENLNNSRLAALSKNRLIPLPSYANEGYSPIFAKGGSIHIKPENRGKFNETKRRTGKTTEELTHSKNPITRKRAIFAQNARKWKHDNGGNLYTSLPNISQHGGEFSNGVTIIGNGGTHEENPFEGVQMGIAPDGNPNLVEEGEVKFNNYIFSNRLKADRRLLKEYNLPTSYTGKTFSEIAKKLNKESEERPNDPISKNGLNDSLSRLQQAQEQVRAVQETNGHKFAKGGSEIPENSKDYLDPGYAFDLYDSYNPVEISSSVPIIQKNPNILEDDPFLDNNLTKPTHPQAQEQSGGATWLRYAPVIGSGVGVITDTLGLTNAPDYSNANIIGNAVNNLREVTYNPLGNYLTYNPFDRDYYMNKLGAASGAARRAVLNQTNGNRGMAISSLLAMDYNNQAKIGELARQAEEYNLEQRAKVEEFNRATNQANAEMALKAAIANQELDKLRINGRTAEANLRDQIDMRSAAGRSANLTNLFESLGDIGNEEFSRNMINFNPANYYTMGSDGKLHYKQNYYALSPEYQALVDQEMNDGAPVEENTPEEKSKANG